MSDHTFIIDHGGNTLKCGLASDDRPKLIPNCVTKVKSERRRPFIGDQLEECKDYSGLFYILPCQKGYIINWEVQRQIWDYIFKIKYSLKNLNDYGMVMTEPYFNFKSIQENLLEIFYEEYNVNTLLLANPSTYATYKHQRVRKPSSLCCLVVDAGYSFTHIIPYVDGKKIKSGIRRIDVGGKALTNHLKDIMSYRQINVMDETYVINQCKEDACYVSLSFDKDLTDTRKRGNDIVRDYVLPDYSQVKRGYVREPGDNEPLPDQQTIRLNNERIQVPELLFYPSDVGVNQIGISHAIHHSIESLPEEVRPHLYDNILLIGGSVNFKNFRDRVESDIRSLANHLYDVNVYLPEEPTVEAWLGAQMLRNNEQEFNERSATKKEYEEKGFHQIIEKFEDSFEGTPRS
ncbi:Actin-related protein 6 [Halotydeus destructor]|nr:Actin-related protein 6 [Halotydeus destructor]